MFFFIFGRRRPRYQMLTKAARVQHVMKNIVTTSYRNSNLCLQISFCHFLTISRTQLTFAPFLTLIDKFYTFRRQRCLVYRGSVYASHTSEMFLLLCHNTLAAKWLITPLVISAATHKILVSIADIFNCD